MKVHVEAKPLHEPLAGGTPGATVSVEPMVAGRVTWSRWMMESPGGRLMTLKLMRALVTGEPAMSVPCPSFLIRHPSAGAILVDTGLHPSIATDGKENFGSLGTRFRMGHGAKQADYLDWKASLFGNIGQSRTTNAKGAAFIDLTPLPELAELSIE